MSLCCYMNSNWLIIAIVFSIVLFWLRYSLKSNRVCIVVLGDIGRSPRMLYHALSFSKTGYLVNIIGYGGSVPHAEVRQNEDISVNIMMEPPKWLKSLPRLLGYCLKAVFQSFLLMIKLCVIPKPTHLLLQNPPSIPSMLVCWLLCCLRGTKFVIDWHNYGYTILGLTLSEKHKLVRFSKWYEHFFGKLADANLCVTQAMKNDLLENWKIKNVSTHYDRPPEIFNSVDVKTQHQLYMKLAKQYPAFQSKRSKSGGDQAGAERTAFTVKLADNTVHKLQCRSAILVSSTSWTEDEDFSVLFNALKKYEDACENPPIMDTLPELLCVITGKGPMKDHYLQVISKTNFKHIEFCTPWLEAEDYPTLLASSDLGVCLHVSSSGLDLPMKVVDMFGSGLPVCAICFKCLPELVKHEENGMMFHCEHELAEQIQDLLLGFPDRCDKLEKYRKNLSQQFQKTRWHESWKETVLPLFS